MASWAPSTANELAEYFTDYYECVKAVRELCGHDPSWNSDGEFAPDEEDYVPSGWERRRDYSHKSRRVNTQEEDGA